MLDRLGIGELAERLPDQLSGGQRQRAAVARAIIHRPSVMLADEPTGALDGRSARVVIELLVEVQREIGATLVVVTHDPAIAAHLDRTVELRRPAERRSRSVLVRYVLADLVRNPRRTLSTMVGVTLGVGLFCGVLFFVDGLSASMTQRAVAPLAIDMQLHRHPADRGLVEHDAARGAVWSAADGRRCVVTLEIDNTGEVAAHEVTVRSVPVDELDLRPGSAEVDGTPLDGIDDNPFAHGQAQTGFNLGTLAPGSSRRLTYRLTATAEVDVDDSPWCRPTRAGRIAIPIAANEPGSVDLRDCPP